MAGFDPEVDSVEAMLPSLSRALSAQRRVDLIATALQTLPLEFQLLAEVRYVELDLPARSDRRPELLGHLDEARLVLGDGCPLELRLPPRQRPARAAS